MYFTAGQMKKLEFFFSDKLSHARERVLDMLHNLPKMTLSLSRESFTYKDEVSS